jgi:HEAT repeats
VRSVPSECEGPAVLGSSLVVSTAPGVASVRLDASEPPIASLDARARVDAALDDPIGPSSDVFDALLDPPAAFAPSIPRLVDRIGALDDRLLVVALPVAAELKDARLVPPLVARWPLIRDPTVRRELIGALGAFDDPGAVPVLVDALKRPETFTSAAAALVRVGTPIALDAVVAAFDERPSCSADERLQVAYDAIAGLNSHEGGACILRKSDDDPMPRISLSIASAEPAREGARATVNGFFACGELCGFAYRIGLIHHRGRWFFNSVATTGVS